MSLPLLTVSQLTRYIKDHIDSNRNLQNLWVKGEISNYRRHSSGHLYFTLKDAESTLQCVMFRGKSMFLKFEPANGMQFLAGGYISVYERDGRYQMYVENLQPDGVGSLATAYEQLKERLGKEGLFDAARKKTLPLMPRKIGIVTSRTGAVISDIVSVSKRRFSGVQLILCPVLVQGDQAPAQIVKAIQLLNACSDIDVLIVGRGGGSLEELWAFNDERVVRAVYASKIPVISAVGHETDFTLTDFAADHRAPTPSAAAEMAVPDKKELVRHITTLRLRLSQIMYKKIEHQRLCLNHILKNPVLQRPKARLNQQKQLVDMLQGRLIRSFRTVAGVKNQQFMKLAEKLAVLNPHAILGRGYSIARLHPDKTLIRTIKGITKDQKIEVLLADGSLVCKVDSIFGEEKSNVGKDVQ